GKISNLKGKISSLKGKISSLLDLHLPTSSLKGMISSRKGKRYWKLPQRNFWNKVDSDF
ncbi:unnamed protein product, partial [Prorocentrum cordatum]